MKISKPNLQSSMPPNSPLARARSSLFVIISLCLMACTPRGGTSTEVPEKMAEAPPDPIASGYRPADLSWKIFSLNGSTYVPMDFDEQTLALTFDSVSKTIQGSSRIKFHLPARGKPIFLLDATITSAAIDGQAVAVSRVSDPDQQNSFQALDRAMAPNESVELELRYELAGNRATFSDGGVGFITNMTDLNGVFFERFGPAGFEDDRFALRMVLRTPGATEEHRLFTNGRAEKTAENEWTILFPEHYSSSSFYAHLTNKPLVVNTFQVAGLRGTISVTVYSGDANTVAKATQNLQKLFPELEALYGAYPHPEFLAYIGYSSGGMEYVGATITSLSALGHELFHSWFGRGMMPAEGRAGWIDEAIASWRDNGYQRADSLLSREPTAIGTASAFQRATPRTSYKDGRNLLSELDLLFADRGGLKPVLRALLEEYRLRLVTTNEVWRFLEKHTGRDLTPYFERYVYGGQPLRPTTEATSDSLHPTPLTEAELEGLR